MDVYEGHGRAKEEGTGSVGCGNELRDGIVEFSGVGDLGWLVLALEVAVEGWDEVAVDLSLVVGEELVDDQDFLT